MLKRFRFISLCNFCCTSKIIYNYL